MVTTGLHEVVLKVFNFKIAKSESRKKAIQ
jgi:hypothetical protein